MLQRGTNVAGYRIDDVLGEGGMGIVYRATQLSLNRVVALKLLTGELASDAGFRTRFQREGQLQAALDHDHIVTVYEAGQIEDSLFLAMRLIDGPTLKDLILAEQLDPRRALRLLAQVAQALDAAHEAGLIHRDIKPQNILIGRGDHAYLADFGLTKAPDDAARLTSTGQFVGTIDYIAPEQIQGEPASAASDCYSLAAVLYECLTGEVPFPRANETATLNAHLTEPPPRATARVPDLPPELDEVIARAMAKDPAARTSSARELIAGATRAMASASPLAFGAQETRSSGAPPGEAGGQLTRAGGRAAVTSPAAVTALSPEATRRSDIPATAPAQATPGPSGQATDRAVRPPAPALSRPLTWGAVLALVGAAVVAGLLVGGSGGSTSSTTLSSSATVGHLQLRYPSSWQLAGSSPRVPGMTFTDPLVLSASRGTGQLSAGEVTDASGPTLLPASFRARIQGALPPAAPVALGSLQAYHYRALHIAGLGAPLSVYAIPTAAGVATIACSASGTATSSFETQCAQVAATLRLLGTTPYPVGPSASYALLLSRTLASLRSAIRPPTSELQAASTPSGQASALRRLAAVYTAAASGLRRAAISPAVREAHNAVIAALERIASGYSGAAAAVSGGSGNAFRNSGKAITSGSTALSSALRRLIALGYRVGG